MRLSIMRKRVTMLSLLSIVVAAGAFGVVATIGSAALASRAR